MNYYIVEVRDEDYRGVTGADFLKRGDVVYIYHHNESGKIPKLYYEIIRRTEAEVFFCETDEYSTAIEEKISELLTGRKMTSVTYIGNGREYDSIAHFDSIIEALYSGCVESPDEPMDFSELEAEVRKKDSIYEIAEKLSLDTVKFISAFTENENDKKKLYQELLHVFGNKIGLAAYQQMRDLKIGPFREKAKEPEEHEPVIYSDITLEDHRRRVEEDKKKYAWTSHDFTPFWGQKSIYEEDEDEFF